MKVSQLLNESAEAIEAIGAGNPRLEAELLLARALAKPRVFLMTHPEYQPSAAEGARFSAMLERRLGSEPLQYVLGDAVFRYLTLRVRPGVLIPRAETEVLVDRAWEALRRWRRRNPNAARPWVIDVGVGSGAILLALMHEEQRAGLSPSAAFRPLGVDIATTPLAVTAGNAAANGLPAPALALADMLGAVNPRALVAGIVSNPPYIATAEMPDLPAEIREHEPHEALHAGADGLGAIRALLDQARPFLAQGAFLCFEIGALQEQAVKEELRTRHLLAASLVFPDLSGRPRVVLVDPAGLSPAGGIPSRTATVTS